MSKWVLLLLLPSLGNAQQPFSKYLGEFSGINTFQDSAKIDDSEAQDTRNIITDAGRLEKRPGNTRVTQILSGNAVKYIHEYVNNTNTRYLITHSSSSIYYYSSSLSSGPVVIATMSASFDVDMVNAFGKVYVVNGNEPSFSWNASNGGSVLAYTGSPACSLIEYQDERLWCANVPNAVSRIFISSVGSDSSWTVPTVFPLNDNDPNVFDIQRNDGDRILCMKKTPWGMFIGKKYVTYIIKGDRNSNYRKQILDPQVGCVDDRGVQMKDGLLLWPAIDGIYAWGGGNDTQLISQPIQNEVRAIRKGQAFVGSKFFTSASDWGSGTIAPTGGATAFDTTTILGSMTNLVLNTTDFRWGQFGVLDQLTTNTAIVPAGSVGIAISTVGFGNAGFEIQTSTSYVTFEGWDLFTLGPTVCIANNCAELRLGYPLSLWTGGSDELRVYDSDTGSLILSTGSPNLQAPNWKVISIATQTAANIYFIYKPLSSLVDSGNILKSPNMPRGGNIIYKRAIVTGNGQYSPIFDMIDNGPFYYATGTYTSQTFDLQFTNPVFGPLLPTVRYSSNGAVSFFTKTSNDGGTTFGTPVFVSSAQKIQSDQMRYMVYTATFATTDFSHTSPVLDKVQFSVTSTDVFTSPAIFLSSGISSWKQMSQSGNFAPSTNISYAVRSASWAIPASDTSIAWKDQTINQVIGVATNTYIQFRTTSAVNSTTETFRLDSLEIDWQDGTSNSLASVVKDHRYYLSVTTIATSSNNDLVMVLQKNGKWTFFGGPSYYSMGIYDNNITAGDSSTNSFVWKTMQDNIYSDDGVAIDSYWITKDFTMDAPLNYKQLQSMFVEAQSVAGSSVTVSFSTDRSSTYTDKILRLDVDSNYTNREINLLAGYKKGRYVRAKVSNNDNDKYFRVNSLSLIGQLFPLRPDDK